MIGLPQKFRIKVYNATAVAINAGEFTVKVRLQKFLDTGALVESAEVTLYSNAGSLATATYDAGAWYDNASGLYLALHGIAKLITTGSPNGTARVFLENTTDYSGTSTSPTDGRGFLLTEFYHTAAAAESRPVRF